MNTAGPPANRGNLGGSSSLSNPEVILEKKTSATGEVTYKKYHKGKFLGKGGFARCYELQDCETKHIYAVKVVLKSSLTKSRAKQKLMSEIKIHRSLSHNNIVKLQHYFEDKENVYILLDLCPNLSLNDMLKRRKRFTDVEVKYYVSQITRSIKYLRTQKVIHRDLKLGNLFLGKDMDVQLGDFGLATKVSSDSEKKRTICGTPNYIAPEVLSS